MYNVRNIVIFKKTNGYNLLYSIIHKSIIYFVSSVKKNLIKDLPAEEYQYNFIYFQNYYKMKKNS